MRKQICVLLVIVIFCASAQSSSRPRRHILSLIKELISAKVTGKYSTDSDPSRCNLADLARTQSRYRLRDFVLRFGLRNRKNRVCPTVAELAAAQSDDFNARIIGGTKATEGQWPWIVYLYELETCSGICGGTLINKKWVLTAAHCIITNSPSLYGVVMGDLEISKRSINEIHRLIKTIDVHPKFDPTTLNNDVALLRLKKSVIFTENVRPACLPPSGLGTDRKETPTLIGDGSCVAMGWGRTGVSNSINSDILLSVKLPIVPDVVCYHQTQTLSDEKPPVFESQAKFCAGGSSRMDTCMGDSGGPLICAVNGTYTVIGVTSYGADPCGQVGRFGVYAKVADPIINDWIRETAGIKQ